MTKWNSVARPFPFQCLVSLRFVPTDLLQLFVPFPERLVAEPLLLLRGRDLLGPHLEGVEQGQEGLHRLGVRRGGADLLSLDRLAKRLKETKVFLWEKGHHLTIPLKLSFFFSALTA